MSYCQRDNDRYNCDECAFVNYGRDCHNNPISVPPGKCDSCGFDADECQCGDYVNTAPLTEAEKARTAELEEEYSPSADDVAEFFSND